MLKEWKVERRVQSGHLYIRTDDFGDVVRPAVCRARLSLQNCGRRVAS